MSNSLNMIISIIIFCWVIVTYVNYSKQYDIAKRLAEVSIEHCSGDRCSCVYEYFIRAKSYNVLEAMTFGIYADGLYRGQNLDEFCG